MMEGLRSGWEFLVRDSAPESFLNALTEREITFYAAQIVDAVTVYVQIPYKEVRYLRQAADAMGSEVIMSKAFGPRRKMLGLGKRTALLMCLLVCAVLLAVSNLFVWRIEVMGNETVPTGAVIRALTRAGGGIGSFWPAFDGEQMRAEMLLMLEDVQWIGLNYRSGAVEVVVRQRREVPAVVDNDEPVHIAAEKAGVLTNLTAKQGQVRAAAGDTVEKGQVLISGAAVSSIGTTRTVHALGRAEARTWYALSARQPAAVMQKAYTGRKDWKISLILGSKRLNFYSDSSIFGDSCDTIIMDYHLCMKDVFSMPVRIMVQQCVYWIALERGMDVQLRQEAAELILMEVLRQKIGEDGKVTSTDFAATKRGEGMTVTLMAECLEEIGEEIPLTEEELRQIQLDTILGEETTND